MREFLRERPWIWVAVLIGLVVAFESAFFYVAGATLGDELEPFPEQTQPVPGAGVTADRAGSTPRSARR